MALICCRGASLRPRLRLGSVPGAWSSGPAGPARQREEKEERRRRRQAAVEARSAAGGLQDELRWTEPAVITYDVPTHPGEKKGRGEPLVWCSG
ncbi:valine--tRNA ligase, mitochondrial-like [Narcine bancroftii]|uniref:valine--tRNA ligase, mitochondrial-like n=1 Tax=Narcine bancroftii TaxID=1343680 RepID=UPI00383105B7